MANRTFRGRTHSENGWPYVDQGSCQWITVPGTNVRLQIQVGQPLTILRAFAADYNAYVEPLRDPDSACWTESNSVDTSNHPGGTAMDLNWNGADGRTFRYGISEQQAYPPPKDKAVRDLLDFYEGMVYCGGFWSIRDWMHFQMGYNTYGPQNVERVNDFIRRKIRADGYSTYRRGGVAAPPPGPDAADILARATGLPLDKARALLPAVADGLRTAECTNVNRIAMYLAQVGHESVSFTYTAEIASGDAYDTRTDLGNTPEVDGDGRLYKGRTWIQITGKNNYRSFSEWAHGKGLVPTATYFVDNPLELSELKWAGIGAAWYWTVARPDINSLSDRRDLLTVTKRINGGTNGLEDRQRRYDRALALGDQLLALLTGGDELTPEQDRMMREIHACLFNRTESWSPLATPGEGPRWMLHEKIHSLDGMVHPIYAEKRARAGDLGELHRIVLAAKGLGKDKDPVTVRVFQQILGDIERTNPEVLERYIAERGGL